jgi:ribonuclease E
VAPIDEEVAHAAADFGGPPVEEVTHQHAEEAAPVVSERPRRHREEAMPEPEPTLVTASEPVAPPKPEPPRRRSTVREPVPFLVGGTAAAPPPAIPDHVEVESTPPSAHEPSTATASDPAAPRRAGWWAKRMFGEKG